MTDFVPLKRIFQYYFNQEHTKPIKEILEESFGMRDTVIRKVNIQENMQSKEWYCIASPLKNIAGNFRGIVFTGIDITEQLERNRLQNWAQLAHDMQTNLSTIRLNTEQLDISIFDKNADRKKKILFQTNLLTNRIRDLVTVGGNNQLNLNDFSSSEICSEVRAEFDNELFPNVEFKVTPTEFSVKCDKQKLIRALRNSIENSIRSFKGNHGIIEVSCYSKGKFACFVVGDNGPGMDEKIKTKMLEPYFSTSKKYGGTGIGTMIMQQVIELHGGEISIDSEVGTGTEITFSIPNRRKK